MGAAVGGDVPVCQALQIRSPPSVLNTRAGAVAEAAGQLSGDGHGKKPCFVVFVDFHGINAFIAADFKLIGSLTRRS